MNSDKPARENDKDNDNNLLIVGLGASAGGLDALKEFFGSVPDQPGMAFVVIVHLSPDHKSSMAELLQAETALEVTQVTARTEIKPDHVYVIPPGQLLSVGDHHLELSDPENGHGLATVDLLFRSLGETKGARAAVVILSGTGTDGTAGMKAVKQHGGLAVVQDPGEAAYPGMPQSAIDTGLADLVRPVGEIARELLAYKENLVQIRLPEEVDDTQVLGDILQRVRTVTGHDFSSYKRSSVRRRIERRMQVKRTPELLGYLSLLEQEPDEARQLLKDLLISVTRFFRDPQAFEALAEHAIPALFNEKGPEDSVRIWVPGCATGEEAYSIAMLAQDHARGLGRGPEVQIFASDIDEAALDSARRGLYPASVAADLDPEYLQRYFDKQDHHYQLKREITDMVLFASHNLLRDPPFSRLDLIACRNLLIYLRREIQSEVFGLLHYALRPGGWLFIGLSDSNLEARELFTAADKEHRIYRRSENKADQRFPRLPLQFGRKQLSVGVRAQKTSRQLSHGEKLHQTLLMRQYAHQSVIIDEHHEIIHATDGVQVYLEYSGGELSKKILDMIRPELRQPLRSLLFRVEQNPAGGASKNVLVGPGKDRKHIEIHARRITDLDFPDGLLQVVFKEINKPDTPDSPRLASEQAAIPPGEADLVETLEKELELTQEQLHITAEEYETSNEELRSSNEELQSMNEELQSMTEELETSQEELQSANEELKSVNRQLEEKVESLHRANSDLKNLMEATEIGILFVDRAFCVQRFTSPVTDIFNLASSDRGRPLAHFTHRLKYDQLKVDMAHVLDSLGSIKKVVSTTGDRWYIMRMRPYRSTEDKIEGVMLTFTEITQLREAEVELAHQRQQQTLATLGLYALEQFDLKAVTHRSVQQLCMTLEMEYISLLTLNQGNDRLQLLEYAGWEPGEEQKTEIAADPTWDIGYILGEEKPVIFTHYRHEQRFSLSPLMAGLDISSGIIIKIKGTNEIYGVMGIYSGESRSFTEQEVNFIQVVANIIGMSIERTKAKTALQEVNSRLKDEVRRSKKYQKEILNASVVERWNIGGYLHDDLAQRLVSIKIAVVGIQNKLQKQDQDLSNEITEVLESIDESIAGIRELTHDILPVDVEAEGVAQALRLLLRQQQKLYGATCELKAGSVIEKIKDRRVATNLYQIIQEAVKNAAIHGQAANIQVVIKEEAQNLKLEIIDDGKGLEATADDGIGEGSGINIMRHRIELLGGTFGIEEITRTGKTGTRVLCTLPLMYASQPKQ